MRMPLSRVSLCLLFAYAKISAFAAPREKAMALSVRPLAMAAETKAEMRGGLAGTVPGRFQPPLYDCFRCWEFRSLGGYVL